MQPQVVDTSFSRELALLAAQREFVASFRAAGSPLPDAKAVAAAPRGSIGMDDGPVAMDQVAATGGGSSGGSTEMTAGVHSLPHPPPPQLIS